MEKLNIRLKKTSESGIFHDSRADSRLFMMVFNKLHDKVNELIDENEKIKNELNELKYKNNVSVKSEKCNHPLPYRQRTGEYTSGYTCTLCGKFEPR